MADENQPASKPTKGYGKRPMWQWIVLYVIIGAVVYGLVYYFFIHKSGSGSGSSGFSY